MSEIKIQIDPYDNSPILRDIVTIKIEQDTLYEEIVHRSEKI